MANGESGGDRPGGASGTGPTLVRIGSALLGVGLIFVALTAVKMISAFNQIAALEGAAGPADLADGISSALVWAWCGAPPAVAGLGLVVIGLIVGSPEER
jgi:hypothetical protein